MKPCNYQREKKLFCICHVNESERFFSFVEPFFAQVSRRDLQFRWGQCFKSDEETKRWQMKSLTVVPNRIPKKISALINFITQQRRRLMTHLPMQQILMNFSFVRRLREDNSPVFKNIISKFNCKRWKNVFEKGRKTKDPFQRRFATFLL